MTPPLLHWRWRHCLSSLIASIPFVTLTAHGDVISWHLEGDGIPPSGFSQGDAVQMNGAGEDWGNMKIGGFTGVTPGGGSPHTLSSGIVYEQSYNGTVASGDLSTAVYHSLVVNEDSAGWGGTFALTTTDPSALVIATNRGPIEQSNSTNTMTVSLDFSALAGGAVTGLTFDMAGLSSKLVSGLLNQDRLILTAFDDVGATVTLDSSYFSEPVNSTYGSSIDGSGQLTFGGTSLVINGDNSTYPDDHTDPNTVLGVDFGSQPLSKLSIDFAPIVNGSGDFSSAGFAISDMNFTIIPEPSTIEFTVFVGIILGLGRRRR